MGAIWLMWCTDGDSRALQQEIRAYDEGARIVRVREADALARIAGDLADTEDSLAAALASADEEVLERVTGELAASSGIGRVLVWVTRLDPGHIARLFRQGATEVIAGRPRALPCAEGADGTRAEGVSRYAPGAVTAYDRDHDPGASGQDERDATADEVTGREEVEHASPGRVVVNCNVDDLEEPDDVQASDSMVARLVARGAFVQREDRVSVVSNGESSPHAPIIAGISGRGGCGLTTVLASMALTAAGCGLRAAVVDLDLMFGNMALALGAEHAEDLALLVAPARSGQLTERDVVRTSTRVRPGLTVWGPVRVPEQAELLGPAVELLLDVLQRESDVVFVDTSTYWGDASAAAIARCDRCLVVGSEGMDASSSAARVIDLACRIGVARTRMTSVFNRLTSHEESEDAATRFEFVCALSSKERIVDGGRELGELTALGHLADHLEHPGPFQESVGVATRRILAELGCPIETAEPAPQRVAPTHRLHLPWKKLAGDAA